MTAFAPDGKNSREIQDAVSYAVGHRIRVEILTALHELEDASATELSRIVHQPLSTVTHHINELLRSGSVRIRKTEKVRGAEQRFYSVVNSLYVTDEEWREMSEEERQEVTRWAMQSMMAEALAAFWAGKITSDPRQFLCWTWLNVDPQARDDIADEQARSWRRIGEIEREAAARCAENGEEPFSLLVASLGFERARTARVPHRHPGDVQCGADA